MGGAQAETRKAPPRFSLPNWIGVVPFFVFSGLFLIGPTIVLAVRSLQGSDGELTLANYTKLGTATVMQSYGLSVRLSLLTALMAGVFGLLLAWAAVMGGLPRFIRSGLATFSGVASNFAGVPLAAAFIFTLGRIGIVTALFELFGADLYGAGFSLYAFWGLALVYLYFQLPLMVLVIMPSLDGLKREWREASENLGATGFQYWRFVGFPVLLPSILGAMILLFGNAFGAHATAYALTGGGALRLATLLIGAQITGDVLNDPGLGYSAAMGMIIIMGLSIGVYSVLQRRSERWLA